MSHPRLFSLSGALGAGLLLGVLASCAGGGGPPGMGGGGGEFEGTAAPGPERRVLVEAVPVGRADVASHLETSGVLESEAQADITPETSGLVTEVRVEEGDRVAPGQVLAVLSSPQLDAGAERARIELDKARVAVQEAEALHGRGALSDRELRDARDALRVAETSFGEASRSAGFTRIESPIAGTVAVRDVRLGEMAGGRRAFQVVDLDRLRVVVQLPERDLTRVREGQSALLMGAWEDGTPPATGRVVRVSPVVDATTGTVRVTIGVDPGQSALRPGQFVKVRLEVDRHTAVLAVPRRALVYEDGEPIVWAVVDAPPPEPSAAGGEAGDAPAEGGMPAWLQGLFGDGEGGDVAGGGPEKDPWDGIPRRMAKKTRIDLGFVDADHAEVAGGLGEGALVVSVGAANLRDEALLKLPGDPEPPPEVEGDDGEDGSGGGAGGGKGGRRRGRGGP